MALGLAHRIFIAVAPWLLLITEAVMLIAVVALTFFSRRQIPVFLSVKSGFSRLARRKTLSIILVGASTLVIRVALIPVWGVPQPEWHDEFSYLLAADTFAHGRLTNPPHPMWTHFEGFHIIQQPTYMSMYPPGQGLILAAGQLLGHPWIGQLLVTALMCSCLCWMLQAWLPPPWALLGACLAVLRLALLSYWMNSYFGTSLPALGGMLVLGALPRIQRHPRLHDALFMGLGLAILANTRPYEGFVFCMPIAVAMIIWIVRQKRIPPAVIVRTVVMPILLILAATGGVMGYYFWRVTGNAFVMPYQVNRQTYAVAPYFIWQKLRPEPVYRHAEMRKFYVNLETQNYYQGATVSGFVIRLIFRIKMLWEFFVGPVFTLPLLALPCVFRDRRMRWPLIIAGMVIAGNVVETWTLVHYLAPAVGLFYLLVVQCTRHLRLCQFRGKQLGQGLARAVPVVCLAMVVLRVSAMAVGARIEASREPADQPRIAAQRQLSEMPGKQLVIVHYSPSHVPHLDWINNRADIDAAKIVWARDMGDDQNRELLIYFKDRHIWRVNADDTPPKLEPFDPSAASH